MPQKSKPLTDAQIVKLEPGLKARKYRDGGTPGLHLLVSAAGTKTWRFRYAKNKREFVITLGNYEPRKPQSHISLKAARAKAWSLADAIAIGEHPAEDRKRQTEPDQITFEYAANEFIERYLAGRLTKRKPANSTEATTRRAMRYCKPLHDLPIDGIKPPEYRAVIDALVDDRKFETAIKTRGFLNKVCKYAYSMGWISRNPIRDLPSPPAPDADRLPAITDAKEFGNLLRKIDAFDGHPTICTALKVLPHVFTRPGELRAMTWREIDFEANLWTIPAHRTKMRRKHKVPLSKQVWGMFADLSMNRFGDSDPDEFVFPSTTHSDRPMSENTINYALRSIGINTKTEHTAHGFRSSASTLLNEARKESELIEHCLGHRDSDKIKDRYNRAELLKQRAELMQEWSDMIDRLKAGKSLIAG